MPQPLSVLSSLSDQIVDIFNKDALAPPLREFDIARALRLIRQVKQYSPAFYHSFLGGLYGITGKDDESINEHKMALSIAPKDAIILKNYGSSLMRMGRYQESYDIFTSVFRKHKDDLIARDGAINSAYFADMPELKVQLDDYRKFTGKEHQVVEWLKEDEEDELAISQMPEEYKAGPYTSIEELQKKLGM
jgi:tetratricopeptide (TPR) repeat protein